MIYPTYNTIIKDPIDLSSIIDELTSMGLHTVGAFGMMVTSNYPICVDGYQHVIKPSHEVNAPVVSSSKFLEIYRDYYKRLHEWIDNLQVGDRVVIEPRRLNANDYPCGYVDSMTEYAGRTMTIKNVIDHSYDDSDSILSINSDRTFYLWEDSAYFTWHASMFVFDSDTIGSLVNKLEMTEINIEHLLKIN